MRLQDLSISHRINIITVIAALGTADVTSNIAGVSQIVDGTGAAAGEVLRAADDVGARANSLRSEVQRFLQAVRAA
jgi:methyl-accepting chemotaxis protein